MKARRAVVAVVVLGTLTACASEKTGGPRTASPAGTTSPAETTSTLPPRPRDLDLTGVDPCTDVLTRDQLRTLVYDVGYLTSPVADTSGINRGPTCSYASMLPLDQPSRKIGSLVVISLSEGAEAWLTDPRRKRPPDRYRLTSVAGFPALVLPNPVVVDNCAVVVDVNDGQYVEVDSSSSAGKGASPDPYCAEALRVAEMIIQNLSARR